MFQEIENFRKAKKTCEEKESLASITRCLSYNVVNYDKKLKEIQTKIQSLNSVLQRKAENEEFKILVSVEMDVPKIS